MRAKVRISKNKLDYFRNKARTAKKEILAYLVGEVVSPQLVVIEDVVYTYNYATQKPNEVRWYQEEYDKVRASAEGRGKRVVGDLHSHPNWDSVMSESDYRAHIEEGHRLCGICSVYGRKTRVRFWIAESALDCVIEYAKI